LVGWLVHRMEKEANGRREGGKKEGSEGEGGRRKQKEKGAAKTQVQLYSRNLLHSTHVHVHVHIAWQLCSHLLSAPRPLDNHSSSLVTHAACLRGTHFLFWIYVPLASHLSSDAQSFACALVHNCLD
jgi:hypothetical protein